ncbi:choice-of-anchor L domain-containing protein [Sanyastnella coralliicola]|uniref:choice-of-anchor L domain-containing protein n=1 Tax=Sanyastnella coralliicola TaxID=3069118 RepID=UPI0027BAFB75|nr:choice-of-anchor L domain-containing protein [Longitalea sp. SCSIO 12813]
MKRLLFTFLSVLALNTAFSQLVVDNTVDAVTAVEDILVGEGVDVFNITFSGEQNQIGSFNSENSNIPISNGVIIATGDATLAIGPNNSPGFSLGGGNFGASDPDLELANPGDNFNDAAILEFDFVAQGDSVEFNYVWSSDEYPEYVNSINDAFGFFISGPGINGPYSDDGINIAIIPGTTLPVSVNNVNAGNDDNGCTNCEFYNINTNNTDPNGTQMDGFTVVLTAAAEVQCGEQYHIRIVIADASDTILDSAVFLEAGSFTSAAAVSASVPNAPPSLPPLTLLEGCVDGVITVFRPSVDAQDTLILNVGGTATEIDDYLNLPDTVVFPDGELTVDIPVSSTADGLEEGIETITISYEFVNSCGEADTINASLNIMDYFPPTLDFPDEIFLCNGESQVVSGLPENGFAPFTYEWSTGSTNETITITGDTENPVTVDLIDYCGNVAEDAFQVRVPEPFEFIDEVDLCLGLSTITPASGGSTPYTYIYPADSIEIDDNTMTPLFEGIYEVTSIDACGEQGTTIIEVQTCETVIPNVFSPNSDGDNDFFRIQGNEGFPGSSLEVFNRWGQLVYESVNYQNNWRGDGLAEGTYYIIYNRSDGEVFTGTATLLRK